MKLLRGKLTYANIVATLCLFLLVAGGTAFAASQLGKNSVGSKQLRKNAVTSAKVKDHSLKSADFKQGQLPEGKEGKEGKAWTPGPTTLQISPENWVAATGGGTVAYSTNVAQLTKGSTVNAFFDAGVTVPSTLQGRPVKLTSMVLCYEAKAAATINRVLVQVAGVFPIEDDTDRTDKACRTYIPASPVTIGDAFVNVVLNIDYTAPGSVEIERLTLNLTD
jgi:hypothetical protein